jgi:hypothetical protein
MRISETRGVFTLNNIIIKPDTSLLNIKPVKNEDLKTLNLFLIGDNE